MSDKDKRKHRKELLEWAMIVVVSLTLYFTGWHKDVIGLIQRGVLATGLIKPHVEEVTSPRMADLNWQLSGLEGSALNLQDYKGQVVFINFWATWCPPCVAEMPDIQSLYEEMHRDVKFVMVSLDQDPSKARQYIDRKGYTLPVYFPTASIPSFYEHTSIPTTYVIASDGTVAIQQHGMAQYNTTAFKDLLKRL